MIWLVLSGFGVAAVLGWLLLRARKTIGKLKAQNDALFQANERLQKQMATGKPSDDDLDERLRRNDGSF